MDTYDTIQLVARATQNTERPGFYKIVGIVLAICSGLFIGVSFVLKKIGLLKANVKYEEEAGEGYGYLKNVWWWSGMTLMIIGEICNFVAYAFTDAILVTPMGALSVVVTTILSAIFLKERLSFVGKVGCFNCIVGSVVIVLNSPEQSSVATIQEMQAYVLSPGFLTYAGIIIVGCIIIALWAGPKYGKKSMLVYISICSLIGGLSVVATQGLGAAIITQIGGTPQFNQWFLYVLFVFVIATLLTEIIYLNKALNIFNAALVTPTYYVFFTSATIITSAILFRGFKGTAIQITTIVLGFLQICTGVILLQLSKSAKDVPDTAVFKGDLDQVRTIAEQEEHESEPKADVIRGAAGIVRAISKNRLRREAAEARRVQEERLDPIGENETVEWDGLRRRKTVLQPGESPPVRNKTVHYPLGLTHFPDDSEDEESGTAAHGPNVGLFSTMRRKATIALKPRRAASDRSVSYGSQLSVEPGDLTGKSPVQLQSILATRTASQSTQIRHVSNTTSLPSDDGHTHPYDAVDTSYKSPGVQWADGPAPPPREDSLQVPGNARRQFSFQNVFSRGRSASTVSDTPSDARPPSSSRGSVFGFSRSSKHNSAGPTEEERLGLVKGDSTARLSPIKSNVAEDDSSPSRRKSARASDYFDDDDFDDRLEGSPVEDDFTHQLAYAPDRRGGAPGGAYSGGPHGGAFI